MQLTEIYKFYFSFQCEQIDDPAMRFCCRQGLYTERGCFTETAAFKRMINSTAAMEDKSVDEKRFEMFRHQLVKQ